MLSTLRQLAVSLSCYASAMIASCDISALAPALREGASELLWPTRCVGCELPGELLCLECREALPWIEQRMACPMCGVPNGALTCTGCKRDWEVRATVAACRFEGTPSRAIRALKDHHELRLAPVMAAAMQCALEEAAMWPALDGRPRFEADVTDAVVFVPATEKAFRRRGFDHMELVARPLAAALGLPLADALVRDRAQDQRGLGRDERASNLASTIRVNQDVSGLGLLLVDDVCTTGATLNEAARALLRKGAASVTACVFARVW